MKNDRIVRIEPEDAKDDAVFGEHQIRPCLRGRSSRWRVYSPDRIKYPMKRVGKRGEGKFKRISWDEATAFIAAELTRVSENMAGKLFIIIINPGHIIIRRDRPHGSDC